MSEYQYYQFLAVDQPLNARQQAEVRALSTRAEITATTFTNEYHWGSFKGDPAKLMEHYYDAHLYFANWGSRTVMLRLPLELLDIDTVQPYTIDRHVSAWTTDTHLLLDLSAHDETGEWDWDEGDEHALPVIVGVRAELADGDLRPLYLAWLAAYGVWDRDEDAFDDDDEQELEPPVPAGLGDLTAPQRALADFLHLDDALLEAASATSPPLTDATLTQAELAERIGGLPAPEKDRLLLLVARGRATQGRAELRRHLRPESAQAPDAPAPRTVAELLDAAHVVRQEHHRRAEAERIAQAARRELERLETERIRAAERAAARERRLVTLANDIDGGWDRVEASIATRKPTEYDAAVELLTDLCVLAQRTDQADAFTLRLDALRRRHERKPSLIDRLDQADLPHAPATDAPAVS